jgi:hypothetical protein
MKSLNPFCCGTLRSLLPHVSPTESTLLPCSSDGFAERSLNLDLVNTDSGEKHTAKPLQVGTPQALFESFNQSFRLPWGQSRGGAIPERVPQFARSPAPDPPACERIRAFMPTHS